MYACRTVFTAADGESKLLFVREAGPVDTKDGMMTGVDIDGLNCVVAPRIDRLCRLSWASRSEKEKHDLYVEIVPNNKKNESRGFLGLGWSITDYQ